MIYLIACISPALEFIKEDGSAYTDGLMSGFAALVGGWAAILIGQFAWYANIFWVVSLIFLLFRGWMAAMSSAFLAILIGLHTFKLDSQRPPANEGATFYLRLNDIKVGFYLWLLSFLVVAFCAMILRMRDRALQRSIRV